MRINYNVSAAIANKHLLGIEDNLSASMERLSSGLKINHSKDNPAGMAISNKMKAQIDGLNRASQNASDGISVIQIADGALSETTSILQRMRELSVQAASDATMTPADKEAIQKEITSLKDEVDRISTDTEYNSKSLLDGSLDTRVYTKNATRVDISDHVKAGQYQLSIDTAATQAGPVTANQNYNSTAPVGASGTMSINGSKVEIEAADTYAEAFEKIRNAAETGETTVQIDGTSGALSFTADRYGMCGDLKGCGKRDETGFSDHGRCVGGKKHPAAGTDDPADGYGNHAGKRNRQSPQCHQPQKCGRSRDFSRCTDGRGCGNDCLGCHDGIYFRIIAFGSAEAG